MVFLYTKLRGGKLKVFEENFHFKGKEVDKINEIFKVATPNSIVHIIIVEVVVDAITRLNLIGFYEYM